MTTQTTEFSMRCLRHAKTEKDKKNKPNSDLLRQLDETGKNQARARCSRSGDREFGLALLSPALRVRETADLVLGGELYSPKRHVYTLSELYMPDAGDQPEMHKALDRTFTKLTYAPLGKYLEEDAADVEQLHLYGRIGWNAITACIEMHRRLGHPPTDVLMGGHAVCLQLIAYNRATKSVREQLEAVNLEECGAFDLNVSIEESGMTVNGIQLLESVNIVA